MKNRKKIYIGGTITGLPKEEYTTNFLNAEKWLRKLGWEPVNPCDLGIPDGSSTPEALPRCLAALKECSAMFVMENWRTSEGTKEEINFAGRHKIDLYFEEIEEDIKELESSLFIID